MAIIRTMIIFLLGVGAAAGAYLSGATQHIPAISTWMHHLDSGGGGGQLAASVPLHIARSSEFASPVDSNCAPVYAFDNRTGQTMLVSFGGHLTANPSTRASEGGGNSKIVVRPGEKIAGRVGTEDEGDDAAAYQGALGGDVGSTESSEDRPYDSSICRSGISVISIEISECSSGVCLARP